jgi:8-oxo-dGTP pyrophosphatase MutT (NUDIX family)
MEKIKFNNIPNPHLIHQYDNGCGKKIHQDFWISRAPAVVGIIFVFGIEGGGRVLIIKRSKNMREEPLKYGAPSGYLDWNETGYEAMTREVYEETSMYLPNYNPFLIFDNNKQPFFILDDPKKDKNENVTLTYLLAFDFLSDPESFPVEIEKYCNHETAEVEWLKLTDFFNESKKWAFNHDERIVMAYKFFNKEFTRK